MICALLYFQYKPLIIYADNGKVERSHRNDQNRFYNYLKFYFYNDLIKQMKSYLNRFNNIVVQVLDWISPLKKQGQKKQCDK